MEGSFCKKKLTFHSFINNFHIMFSSFNPYTNTLINNYTLNTITELEAKLNNGNDSYQKWQKLTVSTRCHLIRKVGEMLLENKIEAANLITTEIGKPISQSIKEIEKCASLCTFYADNANAYLEKTEYSTNFNSYVQYDPLGLILGIMPWNFPFWQVFRFAIPTLLAGNTVLIKPAANVPQCTIFINDLFRKVLDIPDVFQIAFLDNETTKNVISYSQVKGVSLTGSTRAGRAVAAAAGKNLKPVVLELGGSNAMIVAADADIDKAVAACINGRFRNNGQSCIAVKRLLLHTSINNVFLEKLLQKLHTLKIGNPEDADTFFSVLALEKFAVALHQQLQDSVAMGAKLVYGGDKQKAFVAPSVLTNVTAEMPVFKEETFGPVLPVITFDTITEAIRLSNNSAYGLGVSIFSSNQQWINKVIAECNEGGVVVNDFVKSYAQLPFGGTKISGLGRELAAEGLKAFTNAKTVVIK